MSSTCSPTKQNARFISGPIVGSLNLRYGSRTVCFIGGCIGAIGLILASLSKSIAVFMLTFGVIVGQVAPSEIMQNKTFCDLNNVNITCDSNEIIAIESLNFYYHPDCLNMCCRFHNNHSSVGADDNDMQEIRRECSGRQSCSVDKAGPRFFEIVGNETPSYAVLHYACIPGNRTTAICNSKELKSDGSLLYLTNRNYPSVTTGSDTCSCSIEVNTCTSNVTLSILDVDLYLDHRTCDQNIELRDGMGELLERLDCGGYNNSFPARELKSHYVKIDFINNSTQNQEGLFFIGFAASEEIASFSLSCPAKQQTVCLQCEDTIDIPHGNVVPHDVTNKSEGALANVTCDVGYEPDNLTITCLGNGKWENATCRPKDCGNVSVIENGKYKVEDDTTFGAVAIVICNEGYESDKNNITCLETGYWSSSSCTAIHCKSDYQIDNGKVSSAETTVGAIAVVTCNTGYTASSLIVECLSTGEWQDATCKKKGLLGLERVSACGR
ncbi:uncharacterized protein LOC132717141 [Ruditapes philippinarum]|uniref:uncharacterized protein LOC132717141 n=1 Tax=Ruditapes philippinarum TaxID=129788 RepID=UPI00295C1B28|nr:uncharacterized protein LOC132717141 [Ruditapes philippinarum]